MKLAIAQLAPVKGNVDENIKAHCQAAMKASESGAEFVLFSELSLTGYEPDLATELAMTPADPRLNELQDAADKYKVSLCVGLPLLADANSENGIEIGMLLFTPNAPVHKYAKQCLHADEFPFFVAGQECAVFSEYGEVLAPAICYESMLESHASEAAEKATTVYLASVAKDQPGIEKASTHYPFIASKHNMMVVMSNSVGPCDNFVAAGQSGVWSATGEQLSVLGASQEALLVLDTLYGTTEVIAL